MKPANRSISIEARAMVALALPVVTDQIGMMSMGFVDTIMVGRLGKESLGAVGIGVSVYFFYMVFAFGVISAVGPTVAHAFGAGDRREISRSVGQAFWVAIALSALGLVVVWNIGAILRLLGQPPELIPLSERFIHAMGYGQAANLLYAVLRAFTVGLGRTRVTMVIAIGASILNIAADYVLIYGKLGFAPLGVAGAGYATAIVQWMMLGSVLWYVLSDREIRDYRFLREILPIDLRRLGRLLRLGVPIGVGNGMEAGIFSLTSLMMGWISTLALASHQIAINIASVTFMVPLGISTAITTRVGQAMGAGRRADAALAGGVGIGLAALFMSFTAVLFLTVPRLIIGIYTDDPVVIDYAMILLMIAGAFQIFDGIQVSAMGALRGLKDTAQPMVVNMVAYWLVGLPFGYLLGFKLGFGGAGLWWGLTTGLAVAAVMHALRFRRRSLRGQGPDVAGT
ncbi:MAG: hypothetical protein JWQ98_3364 [Chlorobi bacterium]|nr:hypothetical protein [Chlorobiota bacterium]